MIRNKNFSNMDPADIPFDDVFENCNFSHHLPVDSGGGVMVGHKLFPGSSTRVTYRNCNMVNVEPSDDAILENCNTHLIDAQQVAFTDITTVDGVEVSRQDFHDHVHYGKWNPFLRVYEYNTQPVVTPLDY